MSRLDTQFAASGLPMLFERLGTAGVICTPEGGSPVTLTAIVGEEVITVEEGNRGRERVRRREIKITRDPSGPYGGVAAPEPTMTVTIGGEVWEIEDDEPGIGLTAGIAVLPLVRWERAEVGSFRFGE